MNMTTWVLLVWVFVGHQSGVAIHELQMNSKQACLIAANTLEKRGVDAECISRSTP